MVERTLAEATMQLFIFEAVVSGSFFKNTIACEFNVVIRYNAAHDHKLLQFLSKRVCIE